MLIGLISFLCLIALTIVLLAHGRAGLVALVFVTYGLLIGVLTVRELQTGVETYLPNLLGQALGEEVYHRAPALLGDPDASNVDATIPWIVRRPQVHVPSSVVAWGALGVLVWAVARPEAGWERHR